MSINIELLMDEDTVWEWDTVHIPVQEAIDACRQAIKDDRLALLANGFCKYHHQGLVCAIGAVMPKDFAISCDNVEDSFKVSNSNAHNLLDAGIISTDDEALLKVLQEKHDKMIAARHTFNATFDSETNEPDLVQEYWSFLEEVEEQLKDE